MIPNDLDQKNQSMVFYGLKSCDYGEIVNITNEFFNLKAITLSKEEIMLEGLLKAYISDKSTEYIKYFFKNSNDINSFDNSDFSYLFIAESDFMELAQNKSLNINGFYFLNYISSEFNIFNLNQILHFFNAPEEFLNSQGIYINLLNSFGYHEIFWDEIVQKIVSSVFSSVFILILFIILFSIVLKQSSFNLIQHNEYLLKNLLEKGHIINILDSKVHKITFRKILFIFSIYAFALLILISYISSLILSKTIKIKIIGFIFLENLIPFFILIFIIRNVYYRAFDENYLTSQYFTGVFSTKHISIKHRNTTESIILLCFMVGITYLVNKFILYYQEMELSGEEFAPELISFVFNILPILLMICSSFFILNILIKPVFNHLSNISNRILQKYFNFSIFLKGIVKLWGYQTKKLRYFQLFFVLFFCISLLGSSSMQKDYIKTQYNSVVKGDVRIGINISDHSNISELEDYSLSLGFESIEWIFEYDVVEFNSMEIIRLMYIPNISNYRLKSERNYNLSTKDGFIINNNAISYLKNKNSIEFYNLEKQFNFSLPLSSQVSVFEGCFCELKQFSSVIGSFWGYSQILQYISPKIAYLIIHLNEKEIFNKTQFIEHYSNNFSYSINSIEEKNHIEGIDIPIILIQDFMNPILILTIGLFIFYTKNAIQDDCIEFYSKTGHLLHILGLSEKKIKRMKIYENFIYWLIINSILIGIIWIVSFFVFNLILIRLLSFNSFSNDTKVGYSFFIEIFLVFQLSATLMIILFERKQR